MLTLFTAWLVKNWRIAAITAGIVFLLIASAIVLKSCKKKPSIDIQKIDTINAANETRRKEELRKTVDENADTVTTVDGRNVIGDLNRVERDRLTEEKVDEVNKKIEAVHARGEVVTQEGLECLLVPENCS